jgi:hypothetical protein
LFVIAVGIKTQEYNIMKTPYNDEYLLIALIYGLLKNWRNKSQLSVDVSTAVDAIERFYKNREANLDLPQNPFLYPNPFPYPNPDPFFPNGIPDVTCEQKTGKAPD